MAKCDTTAPVGQVDFGQMYSPSGQRYLVAKFDTTSGQVDLFIGG